MKQALILIFLFLGYLCFDAKGEDMNVTQYCRLSAEALSAGRYKKAIDIAKEYLDNNVNSNACSSEVMASLLYNIKSASLQIGKEDDYYAYVKDLYRKLDSSRSGALIRTFVTIALDCKGDYAVNSRKRHSFTDKGDNSEGLIFYLENIDALPADMIASKPLLEAWLHIIKADLNSYGDDSEGALAEIRLAEEILKSGFSADSPEQLIPALARELVFAMQGNWNDALRAALATKKEIEKRGTNYKEWYAVNARLLQYHYELGNYSEAANVADAASIRESVFESAPYLIEYRSVEGPMQYNSPSVIFSGRDYYQTLLTAAKCLIASGNETEGAHKAAKTLYLLKKQIGENYSKFAFNKADSRLKGKVDLLVETAPALSVIAQSDTTVQGLAYDAALLYKQLSLSAGTMYRNLAARIGNQVIIDRYKELETTRAMLDDASPAEAASLIEKIANLESNLERNLSSRAGNIAASLPDWHDVRATLRPDEAAIEFSIASTAQGDRYIASVLKNNSSSPEVVVLGEIERIDNIEAPLTSTEAYDLLWKPLESSLSEIKTVYFSPAGKLNIMPIEYLPVNDRQNFNDIYTPFRLSSTRELALGNNISRPDEILLYGGVKYDLDANEQAQVQDDAQRSAGKFYSDRVTDSEVDAPGLRAGVAFLPATIEEIHNIEQLFKTENSKTRTLEGSAATETSIKELSGSNLPVLHIATHGFTVPRKSRTRLGRMLAHNDDRSTFEEQSLGRSGLMLAGAANTLQTKENERNGYDDGILTGREISRIDLSGLNTVVLSACESGLGDVGSEGVIGLQRGLKKAGVRTLVMSLWKVSDEATSLLMTEFYRQLLSGRNPADAMKLSQDYLRNYDNGKFNDYQYWAAFIILDAI